MIHTEAFQQYVHSPAFLDPLSLPPGTDIPFVPWDRGSTTPISAFATRPPARTWCCG